MFNPPVRPINTISGVYSSVYKAFLNNAQRRTRHNANSSAVSSCAKLQHPVGVLEREENEYVTAMFRRLTLSERFVLELNKVIKL